ncbi:MAG: response regulator [Thaumarchaeota archaeon]|nr:response regulator [Nitrososphaerota archaeon]MDE1867786.1 response regulator [Nitrososphaerota archaeon]
MGEKRQQLRALAIDANQDVLNLFVELLQLKDFQVVGKGHSGQEAVEMYRTLRPDITFLDVFTSDGDGLYALEKIREINPNAIVIMVTADLVAATAERLKELHASAVIYKPFDINDIVNLVKDLISKTNVNQTKFLN